MRLQSEAHSSEQRHRHRDARGRQRPFDATGGKRAIRDRRCRHDPFPLADIIACHHQGERHGSRQQRRFHWALGAGGAQPRRQPPAQQPEQHKAQLQRQHPIERSEAGDRRRYGVEQEDKRRIDVDQAAVERLASQPALGEGKQRRDIMVKRRGKGGKQAQHRRQEADGAPEPGAKRGARRPGGEGGLALSSLSMPGHSSSACAAAQPPPCRLALALLRCDTPGRWILPNTI